MKHNIRTFDLKPQDVRAGMCVFPKKDYPDLGQSANFPVIIHKNKVDFFKENSDNYTWQEVKQFKK